MMNFSIWWRSTRNNTLWVWWWHRAEEGCERNICVNSHFRLSHRLSVETRKSHCWLWFWASLVSAFHKQYCLGVGTLAYSWAGIPEKTCCINIFYLSCTYVIQKILKFICYFLKRIKWLVISLVLGICNGCCILGSIWVVPCKRVVTI